MDDTAAVLCLGDRLGLQASAYLRSWASFMHIDRYDRFLLSMDKHNVFVGLTLITEVSHGLSLLQLELSVGRLRIYVHLDGLFCLDFDYHQLPRSILAFY